MLNSNLQSQGKDFKLEINNESPIFSIKNNNDKNMHFQINNNNIQSLSNFKSSETI